MNLLQILAAMVSRTVLLHNSRRVQVVGVELEDGSGHKFNIKLQPELGCSYNLFWNEEDFCRCLFLIPA